MKKYLKITLIALVFFFGAGVVLAQDADLDKPKTAEAQILKVLDQREILRENGSKAIQQNLELGILTGPLKGQTEIYTGISGIDVVSSREYKVNDKVLVSYNRDETGGYVFYVTDYVRNSSLLWLFFIFLGVIILVGGKKGFMALLSLAISFVVIVKVLVPLVFAGYDPLLVGVLVSFVILLVLIYLTEGWNKKSHVAIWSIVASLAVTTLLAIIFGYLSRLSGASNEEIVFLMDAVKTPINFQHLLLAAIIIGTLGVLDDLVIGQVEAVEQIRTANPKLKNKEVFKMAMNIGHAHLGAIINTLFLAYVSAALPLVLLFNIHQEPFLTVSQIINNEDIATEIVRTLVGVIGLCLSAPIATLLATKYLKNK